MGGSLLLGCLERERRFGSGCNRQQHFFLIGMFVIPVWSACMETLLYIPLVFCHLEELSALRQVVHCFYLPVHMITADAEVLEFMAMVTHGLMYYP